MKRTKAQPGGALVARMLQGEEVRTIYGIPDGTYFGLLKSLEGAGISLVTPRHETNAVHMAGAHARVTGGLGVCIASNGPGVANALPGVAVENAEGNRVLLITSARRTGAVHPDRAGTFQSFAQVEVTRPMTKWSVRVPSFQRLPDLMRKALRLSFTGRPGVVHIDIPEDILNGSFELPEVRPPSSYRNVTPPEPREADIARAADLLLAAERPMIHAGSGVLHAGAEAALASVARLLHAPVLTSWGARSAVDERELFSVPMIHVELNHEVRRKSDAVLILGSRLGETDFWAKPPYWAKPSDQRAVQVDTDPETIGLNRPVDLGIVACARVFLTKLAEHLLARRNEVDVEARRGRLLKLADERARLRSKLDLKLEDRQRPMHPAHVAPACQEVFGDDAIVVLDGGNTVIWGNFFHEVRAPRSTLSTFKFGMLGAGVAQALGAKAACPDRPVYCIIGDGAFGFQPQEIETAVRSGLKVVYIVLSDRQWGMVKINQSFNLRPIKTLVQKQLGPEETINTDLGEVAWDEIAAAMGAHAERVDDPDALKAALARCHAQDRPAVVHVDVDPVKHMWAPALKAFKDMHAEPEVEMKAQSEKRTVFVTGGAGYLGSVVLRHLVQHQHRVVSFDVRPVPGAERLEGVEYLTGDIRRFDLAGAMESGSIDTVVHLASVVERPRNMSLDEAFEIDVGGTRRLLEACATSGVEHLVLMSSGAVYGYDARAPAWMDEADPLGDPGPFDYAVRKRAVEALLAEWRDSHPALSQLVLRPGTVVGSNARNQITHLFEGPWVLGLAGRSSPFVFIWDEDLAACVRLGIETRRTGVFNVAGDGTLSLRDIARRTGKRYVAVPPRAIRLGLSALGRLGLSRYGPEQVAFLEHRPVLSNRRLKEEFGYTPRCSSRQAFESYLEGRHHVQ